MMNFYYFVFQDIRKFFGGGSAALNKSKANEAEKAKAKTVTSSKSSKKDSKKQPSSESRRVSPRKNKKPLDYDNDVEIIEDSEDDEFTSLKAKSNSAQKSKRDKNGNRADTHGKKSAKRKRAKMVVSPLHIWTIILHSLL